MQMKMNKQIQQLVLWQKFLLMILSYVFHQKMKIPILLKDKGNENIIKLTYKFSLAEVKTHGKAK